MVRTNNKIIQLLTIFLVTILLTSGANLKGVYAMPFYDLQPKKLCLRAEFYTSFLSSSSERINNIKLASKSINGYFLDVGGEFSFNRVVGARTLKRGYKEAKIIVGGKFVEGVGGGVCQVSSTLYNAVLLAGLKITEYHPHSLLVGYVAPSFDAMVNSNSADLRFENTTHNPIIIYATTTDTTIKFSIYGEPMKEKYVRESVVKEYLSPQEEEIIIDTKKEYPDLLENERKVLVYAKQGVISQGYIIKMVNGKVVDKKQIRKDKYAPIRQIVVIGTAPLLEENAKTLHI